MNIGNYTTIYPKIRAKVLESFIEGCLNAHGIKSPITKGKIKRHGISLIIINDTGKLSYRLEQRGVPISEIFTP